MRRKVIVGAVVTVIALALAGCGRPDGVDGNLTNGWAMPGEPKLVEPTAPACYAVGNQEPTQVSKWPAAVDCGAQHTVETIAVGHFTGADADRSAPPSSGGAERRKAYEECAKTATDYLGSDWRTGRLGLSVVLPVELYWEAGARWFRCDMVEYEDLEDFKIVNRVAPLKGGLGDNSQLKLGCASVVVDGSGNVDKILPADCGASHNGEFVGIFDQPDGQYQTDAAARRQSNINGCRGLATSFTAVPDDANFQYRTGQVATPFNKADWEIGNRGVRCYLWTVKPFTRSLKGIGPDGLPINYG